MSGNDFDREITFEIAESIGIIASYPTGWKKELNIVSWNGGAAKYDIRDWDPEHGHMSRGVTLHEKEMRRIIELFTKHSERKADTEGRNECRCAGDGLCGGASCGKNDVSKKTPAENSGNMAEI